jgi:tetratricopeptide (TPR) repeat protein
VPLLEEAIRAEPARPRCTSSSGSRSSPPAVRPKRRARFRAAIARDPGFALAHHHLGVLLEKTRRLEDALVAFPRRGRGRAARMEPPRARGAHPRALDRRDEALQELRELIRLAPDRRSSYRIDAYRLLRESERSTEGAQLVLDGLAARPSDHDLALLAAWILATTATRACARENAPSSWPNASSRHAGAATRTASTPSRRRTAGGRRYADAVRTIDEALQSAPT